MVVTPNFCAVSSIKRVNVNHTGVLYMSNPTRDLAPTYITPSTTAASVMSLSLNRACMSVEVQLMLVSHSSVGVRAVFPVGLSVPTPLFKGSERDIDQSALTNDGKAMVETIIMQNIGYSFFLQVGIAIRPSFLHNKSFVVKLS